MLRDKGDGNLFLLGPVIREPGTWLHLEASMGIKPRGGHLAPNKARQKEAEREVESGEILKIETHIRCYVSEHFVFKE